MAQLLSGVFTGKYVPAWGLGGSMGAIKAAVDHPTADMSCAGVGHGLPPRCLSAPRSRHVLEPRYGLARLPGEGTCWTGSPLGSLGLRVSGPVSTLYGSTVEGGDYGS